MSELSAETVRVCPRCGGTRIYTEKIGYSTISWPYPYPEHFLDGVSHCLDCEQFDGKVCQ